MENQPQNPTPILELAWRKFAQLDAVSTKRTVAYGRLRLWIAIFGVLATLFAILTTIYPDNYSPVVELILRILLIASPIIASVLAAFANKFFGSGDWLISRAGAEEILKEVYIYRTILQNKPKRHEWLEKRLVEIQRSVYRGLNGELVMKAYKGTLPPQPRFDPRYPDSDPGFNDITGDEYFKYRLENQLTWHVKKVNEKQRERTRLQVLILASGAVGAFLAAFGLNIWVALAASLTTTFLGWQELKNLDVVVRNYSKVIMELTIISDHWTNLSLEERTQSEFFKMVNSTEDILWSRNVEYIKAMQEALKESDLEEEASLVNRVIQEQREADQQLKQSMRDSIVNYTSEVMDETTETLSKKFEETLGSLAEEASSDVVQAELAAMKEAIIEFVENIGITSKLQEIADEFKDVDVSGNTPTAVLNDLISRYPKTSEVKG